nr:MFS transporter [Morganella morganii]
MLKYVIFSFWIVLMYPLGVDLHLTGIPQIAADLNAPESALHIAFSVYLAGMAAMMLIAGWCADHIGRRPVALAGAVIFCLASVAAGAATTTGFFFGARFAQGAGAGFCYVVTFALLRDVLSGQARTKVLSVMNGITCIAPVLAPVIGFIILRYFHWSVMFYFSAGYALVSILFCLFFIKETRPDKQTTEIIPPAGNRQQESFLNAFFSDTAGGFLFRYGRDPDLCECFTDYSDGADAIHLRSVFGGDGVARRGQHECFFFHAENNGSLPH